MWVGGDVQTKILQTKLVFHGKHSLYLTYGDNECKLEWPNPSGGTPGHCCRRGIKNVTDINKRV